MSFASSPKGGGCTSAAKHCRRHHRAGYPHSIPNLCSLDVENISVLLYARFLSPCAHPAAAVRCDVLSLSVSFALGSP
ncbi:MAG: hypothetical protein IJC98_04735 [Clostridia bacterium]|nr:hypothetical protein [Clostridia bacterium]